MSLLLACAAPFDPADSAGGSEPLLDSANILATDFPDRLGCGATGVATLRVQNSGSTTWDVESYKLGAVADEDPFADTRVYLEAPVAPDEDVSFSLSLVAPATAGGYLSDWQMVHEGVRWFGEDATAMIEVAC